MIGYTGIPLFEMMQNDPPAWLVSGIFFIVGYTSGTMH